MTWFFFALLAPALFALSNQIDKFLLHHKVEKDTHSVARLIIYSSFIGIIAMPIILLFGIEPFVGISGLQIAIMILVGIFGMTSLWFYFHALEKDDASIVTTLYQTIPVIQLILGYLFLSERLSLMQLIGFFVILIGAVLILLDTTALRAKKIQMKKGIVFMMLASSFMFALSSLFYKWVVIDSAFGAAMFWEYTGATLFGLILCALSPVYRREVRAIFRVENHTLLFFNLFNELLTVIGMLSIRYASIFVPVALATIIGGTQPIFVVLYGWFFTRFAPKFITENITRDHMIQKFVAIAVIIGGVIIITI